MHGPSEAFEALEFTAKLDLVWKIHGNVEKCHAGTGKLGDLFFSTG